MDTDVKSNNDVIQSRLNKLLNDDPSREEVNDLYDTWSNTYDQDYENLGYVATTAGAKLLSSKMKEFGFDQNVHILDVACGTGMVGEGLRKLGHNNIDGVDMSQESLKISKKKGIYKNLFRGFLQSENSKDLGVKANQYDAVICIGVLTPGHVGGKALDDLVYAVKPGGLICFGARHEIINEPQYGFKEKVDKFCQEKKWELVKKIDLVFCTASPNMHGTIFAYKML